MRPSGGVGPGASAPAAFAAFREIFGFVPGVFRAQTLLPRAVEAEAALTQALLGKARPLSRVQKELILLIVAGSRRNSYCATLHHQNLFVLGVPERQLERVVADYREAHLPAAEKALLDFAVRFGGRDGAAAHGWTDESLLDAILITAWGEFLCTLASGLDAPPDFEPIELPPAKSVERAGADHRQAGDYPQDEYASFDYLRREIGFVPRVFRAQMSRPDVLEAEIGALRDVLHPGDVLTRVQKELIQLVVAGANRNAYWAGLHSENLRRLGTSAEDADRILRDHRQAELAEPDKALLDFVLKHALAPAEFSREDWAPLRGHRFSEEQIIEAVVTTALAQFFARLQSGLGAAPDPEVRSVSAALSKRVHLRGAELRHTGQGSPADPDAELVSRVRAGDVDAFEELMNRHSRRIYRTLVGILANDEEARDAMQDSFFKAFRHLGEFRGNSKFSTWLISIASNTALQLLRERRRVQSLDDEGLESEEGFRPKELQAWGDDPEQLYSKAEVRSLVETTVMKLPVKYRVVLMLRDIEQLSMEEAAESLGLGMAAFKARLLRGRLMVREALSPQFSASAKGGVA